MEQENYPSGINEGEIEISKEVITTIAAVATTEIEGLGEMKSSAGLSGVFKREGNRGVQTELEEETVKITITIAVKYGYPVHEVAKKVQERVKEQVESMTGLEVGEVNVDVDKLEFQRESETSEQEE